MGVITGNKNSSNVAIAFQYNPLLVVSIPSFWRYTRNTFMNKLSALCGQGKRRR